MIYAAATFWLMMIVLLAWGVHQVWVGMAKPRTVNAVLLPGTLVAQLGHVVGLLITGATVNDTALMKNDDKGEPATAPEPKPKIPVVGPVVVALLPMLGLGGMIYLVIRKLGAPIVAKIPPDQVATGLPGSMAAFWDQLRGLITLAQDTSIAIQTAEIAHYRVAVFAYLMICLTVRMAPFPGNVRGHLGAIVTLGVLGWLAGTVFGGVPEMITQAWPLLTLTVGWLLLLMMLTLVARAAVSAVQMVLRWEQ